MSRRHVRLAEKSPNLLKILTLAVSSLALATGTSVASEAAIGGDVIYVYGTNASAYGEDISNSATRTQTPIEDIPQAITIITQDAIRDQGMTGMAELVRYVPGVSMEQGEGHRDAPVLRGTQTTADFFVDGMRDDLQYLRDLYTTQRVDVLKGPSALIFGRGTGGGAINRVSKRADGDSRRDISLSLGSEGQARLSGEIGAAFTDTISARLNGVIEESETFRDYGEISRLGIAPTVAIDLSDATTLDLYAEYFEDERIVDRGVPSENGRPWSVSTSAYFGNPDISHSEISVATLRARMHHKINETLSLQSSVSYGDYDKFYRNVYPGGAVDTLTQSVAISAYNSATKRENLLSQTDLIWTPQLAGMEHTILAGIELGRQQSDNHRVNASGSTFSIDDRGRNFLPDLSVPAASDNKTVLNLFSVLLQDQIKLSEQFKAVLGVRYDNFDLDFDDQRPVNADAARKDEFVSPRFALIWSPLPGFSAYGSWSQSFLPQSGEQFSSLDATRETLDPEEFENQEIGLRWEPRDELLFTAALYQLDRRNSRAPGAIPGTIELTGSQRSQGIEFGVQGELRKGWDMIGALAFQEAEITSTTSSASAGSQVAMVPEVSASLWNRFELTQRLDAGFGIIHQGEQFTSSGNTVTLPAYTRLDAALYFAVNDAVDFQINVENLTDETYWPTAHGDNNISPGAPRTFKVTLSASL